MTAIYKKELRSLFTNMSGAIAIAAMLLVTGLMFRYYNLYNGVLTLHYTVSNSTLVFFIVIPILSMRSFAEEKHLKTDQLLLTSPVSPEGIVLGKYLSLVTVFAIPVLVMCLYPLIMLRFGRETLLWDYSSILAFFVMGCAYLAVGMFLSSCTENSVIAAILTLLFLFATQMLSSVFTMISQTALTAMLFLLALAVLVALLVFLMTQHFGLSLIVLGVLGVSLIAAYALRPDLFSGRTESLLRILDFSTHFSDFAGGVFALPNLLFFLSYAAAGLLLTIRSLDKPRRSFAYGSWSLAMGAVGLASILVVNIIVRTIPDRFTTFDVSSEKLYSIGEISKGVLDTLTEPVTLRLVTEAGQEDEAVVKLVESYAAASDAIVLDPIDAVAQPTFAAEYGEENVPLNSVIVVSGDRHKLASYYSFYGYDSYYSAASSFDAEGQITSAIAAVSMPERALVRYTTGHDELELGSEMTDALAKANMETAGINLLAEEIPEDLDVLIICAPASDFEEAEVRKVLAYLENGGKLLLMTMSEAVTGSGTPNLDRIAANYGVRRQGGLVLEGDSRAYVQAPYLILPETGSSSLSGGLSNRNIICALPEALAVEDTDEAVYTVNTVLATSPSAYRKEKVGNTVEKEAGDEEGQFVLAVQIEETPSMDSRGEPDVDLGTEAEDEEARVGKVTRILYYSTPCLFSSAALATLIQQETALPEGNTALFAKSLAYLAESGTAVAVEAKTLQVPQTLIDGRTQMLLGNAAMLALPIAVLAAGFAVFARRRRR